MVNQRFEIHGDFVESSVAVTSEDLNKLQRKDKSQDSSQRSDDTSWMNSPKTANKSTG